MGGGQANLAAYGCILLWISLSTSVILYNKWILAYSGFPYPIALTLWHMVFASLLASLIVGLRFVEPQKDMTGALYLQAVLPIGLCFAGTLWLGNATYLYLSVSFIQMLKALMPVAVFFVGCLLATEKFSLGTLANMLLISVGICIASFGEINFVWAGVVLQLASVATESTRLTLVQILLQRRGLTLNPITTLYYVAPCCTVFLALPWIFFELPKMMNDDRLVIDWLVLFSSAAVAFALNMAVFLLIGKTSALTMNVAGVVKDWLLIGLSVLIYGSAVTALNLGGYGLAFLGVCWYNYQKTKAKLAAGKQAAPAASSADAEAQPLVGGKAQPAAFPAARRNASAAALADGSDQQ